MVEHMRHQRGWLTNQFTGRRSSSGWRGQDWPSEGIQAGSRVLGRIRADRRRRAFLEARLWPEPERKPQSVLGSMNDQTWLKPSQAACGTPHFRVERGSPEKT